MKKGFCRLPAVVVCILPLTAFGHSYGPKPRVTAGPGDDARACTACHSSSALNSGSGSVAILLQGGPVYVPGVKQRIAVQISDPKLQQQRWGFQLTARLNSDSTKSSARAVTSNDTMSEGISGGYAPMPCSWGPYF